MEEKAEADLVIEIATGLAVELFIKSLSYKDNGDSQGWNLCNSDFLINTSFEFAQKLVNKIVKVGN